MKPSRTRRTLVALASAAAALLVVQTITYFAYAERLMPRSALRQLSDYRMLRGMDFVLVSPETWAALTDEQKTVLSEELSRLVGAVYYSDEAVPDSCKHYAPITEEDRRRYEEYKQLTWISPEVLKVKKREIEAGRRVIGYKNGVRIGWQLEKSGLFWMRSCTSDRTSSTGAESRSDVYVWLVAWWVPVYNVSRAMA